MRQARRLVLALLLALLAAAPAGCTRNQAGTEGSAAAADSAGSAGTEKADSAGGKEKSASTRERATTVNAARAVRGDLVKPVVAEGTIRARHQAEIRSEVAGEITRVTASEGDALRRGQLIVKIDDRRYEVAVEEARAKYLQALSLLAVEDENLDFQEYTKDLRDQFANLESLERKGQISREERMAREIELDVKALKGGKFRAEIAAARSGVSVARAELERARLDLEHTEIRAPFDGIVTGLTLSRGQQMVVNETICSIVDNVNLEAVVGVLEADIGNLAVGRPGFLDVPALGKTFDVTVDVISPEFDREARTCDVIIRLTNPDGRLRPGMFARARIAGETLRDRLLVPREAILTREGRPLLFKVDGDRAKWLYVTLGESNDHLVEIQRVTQGGSLEPGDRVIVSDHLTLAHDAKIKVRKTVDLEDPWVADSRVSKE